MYTPILQTRLFIPTPSSKLVTRPRLVERILAGLEGKLTLLSAPAGFGKTTLLSAFVAHCHRPVAWMSLDSGDNDPVHFLTYLIAALQTVEPGLGEGLKSALQAGYPGGVLPIETVLTQLLNEIAKVEHPMVLVLDDLHTLSEAQVHQALIFMLEHLPPALHLIVASRADPPWPLARQRARGEMTELRAADLRFNDQEAGNFLLEKMELSLQPDQVQALQARTEGWAAGLQLAAVALQSQGQSQAPASFVAGFTGNHRFVVDYLTDEVLQRQPESVQAFLLHTALLNRMNASLCSALLAKVPGMAAWPVEDCQDMLEYLENANLFLVPLDEQRHWYRYHHLFADLLRHRLQQKAPHLRIALHHAASAWYAGQAENLRDSSLVEEALQHAQAAAVRFARGETTPGDGLSAANDGRSTADVLEQFGEIFWQQGEHSRLRFWIEQLPAEALAKSTNLNILYAWLLLTGGDYTQASAALARAELLVQQPDAGHPPSADLRGKLATVQAFLATFSGNFPAIIPAAREALAHLSGGQSTWRALASSALGDALSLAGDTRAGLLAYREAWASSRPNENPYLALNAGVKLVMALRQTGQLDQALEIIEQQLETADSTGLRKTSMAGLLLAVKGDILCEWGRIQDGLQFAQQGVQICEQGNHIGYLGWSYLALARIQAAAGSFNGVEQVIQRFDAMQPNLPPWLVSPHEALRGLLWVARADFPRMEVWAAQRHFKPDDERMLMRAYEYLAYTRILIAQEHYPAAEAVIQQLHQVTTSGGQVGPAINTLVVEALLYERMGDRSRAAQALETALHLAQPGRFLQTFLQEGAALWPVLQAVDSARLDPAYYDRIVVAFRTTIQAQTGYAPDGVPLPASRANPDSTGLLSARELEVLRLMSDGLPNRQIADRLHISLNTVLFHSKNIFGKLNTTSRTQAVARAREAGIL